MNSKERFIEIFKSKVKREGAEDLLKFLMDSSKSDFFTAPASAKYHSSYEGGLLDHSLNVYDCLCKYLNREFAGDVRFNYSEETVAIVSLLHDICKVNVYKKGTRNVKNEITNQWEKVPVFEFDDQLPYGHGEKSVYMITPFMKLTREEAFAIRYHMGFSNETDIRNVSKAYELYPLALALSTADMEATYYLENDNFKK